MLQSFNRGVDYAKTAYHVKKLSSYDEQEKDIAKQYVASKLIEMKGFAQKIGQTLSLNELTSETKIFTDLTEREVIIDIKEIFNNFKHYHYDAQLIFETIHRTGISASLSQVHRAVLRTTKEDVAVKIQHRGIRSTLETDIKFIDYLLKPLGHFKKDFDIKSFQAELSDMVLSELDYRAECEHINFFEAQNIDYLIVPHAYDYISTNEVLVMEWCEGEHFNTVLNEWCSDDQSKISEHLIDLFFRSLLQLGRLHTDPHIGNYRFKKVDNEAKIILYDFGCVKNLSSNFMDNFKHVLLKLRNNENPFDEFIELGFDREKLLPLRDQFVEIASLIFYPMLVNESVKMSEWNLSEKIEDLLGENRYLLRHSGQGELLYIMRSFQGLISYLDALDQEANWYKIIDSYID